MTPEPTTHPAVTLLEKTREDLYRLADRAPALSPRLSAATLAITESLPYLGEATMTSQDLHKQLLAAANAIAAARHGAGADQELQLQLAHAFGVLTEARQLLAAARRSGPARHLRLIHSS